jgi:hypothetical protein
MKKLNKMIIEEVKKNLEADTEVLTPVEENKTINNNPNNTDKKTKKIKEIKKITTLKNNLITEIKGITRITEITEITEIIKIIEITKSTINKNKTTEIRVEESADLKKIDTKMRMIDLFLKKCISVK